MRRRSILIGGLSGALLAAFASSCAPVRPENVRRARSSLRVEQQGSARVFGQSFLTRRQGILEARFSGGPYDRGYARGKLAYSQIVRGERAIHDLIDRFFPSPIKRFFLKRTIAWNLRESIPAIPAEHAEEITGLSDSVDPDPFPNDWNPFARHLALHAIHDFSQRYVDETPLAAACTGFAASGAATSNGHVLLARNFDFEAGDLFDREKIVAYIVPAGGIPYLSVTFGGLTGVTSGFNREGIGVAIHAWSGGPTAASGEPATLVAADVLEHAATMADAVRIVEQAPVFVSDIYLVADGKTGEIAALEKTPQAFAVRRGQDWLTLANHPETPEFSRARPLHATSTSTYRAARLEELLSPVFGRLDVSSAARILRDRRGLKDKDIGPGNRNAVNALIGSHSVIFDLSARRAWVAEAPHGLGRFVAYSLDLGIEAPPSDPRFGALALLAVDPDPWFASGGFRDFEEARRLVTGGRRLLRSRRFATAAANADRALRLAPGFVDALALRAEAEVSAGRLENAQADCAEALARDPSPPTFERSLKVFCAAVAARKPAGHLAYPVSPSDPSH